VWQKLDTPLIIHFWDQNEPLSNQSLAILEHLADELQFKQQIHFLNLRVDLDYLELLIDGFKVLRYPTVVFYDYGKELARLDDIEVLRSTTLRAVTEKLLAGELDGRIADPQ
jgi:thiol-disulfide isomerase/thioredoxin